MEQVILKSKVYCICGFVCSGKTTYAKQLAAEKSAFRFSIDEWMIPLFSEHMDRDLFDARLGILQDLFKDSALQLMKIGVSVIFDFGFWKRSHRSSIKQWAEENNLDYEMIYIEADSEECNRRAIHRNGDRGNKSYEMTPEMLSLFWSWFEIPTSDEAITISKQDGERNE